MRKLALLVSLFALLPLEASAANIFSAGNRDTMTGVSPSTWVVSAPAAATAVTLDGHAATRITDTGGTGYLRLGWGSGTVGTTYTYSFCVRNNGGTTIAGGIRDGNTAGSIIAGASYFSTISDGATHRIAWTFAVPAGSNVQFQPVWTSGAGVDLHIWGNYLNTGASPEATEADQCSISGGGGQAATPTASPAAGTYSSTQSVTLSCTSPSPTIRYTTNGVDPTGSSTVYSSAISVSSTTTIKAICQSSGLTDSAVMTATYTINAPSNTGFSPWWRAGATYLRSFFARRVVVVPQAATPTISPAAGAVSSGATLAVTCSTSGSSATCNLGSGWSSCPATIASDCTVQARCTGAGLTDSIIASSVYTVASPTAAAPTISPSAGAVSSGAALTVTCSTPGSSPSCNLGSGWAACPATITGACTVQARCTGAGLNDSTTTSASYTIGLVTPPPSPGVGGSYLATANACAAEPLVPPAWQPSTLYVFGQRVTNDGGKVYQMVSTSAPTGGISSSSGPSGTGASIADGNLTWAYAMASATGAIRYVCDCDPGADSRCVVGSDSNDGTSPSTPWRTLNQARTRFNAMAAGDTVALCRGGYFTQANDSSWGNSACRAANNCTLRDYYAPWDSNQSAVRPTIFSPSGRSRGMPIMSGGAGYRILNIRLAATTGVVWGYGLSSTLTDLTICNNEVEGFGVGLQDDCGDNSPTTLRTVVIGSRFLENRGQGILAGGPGTIINSNYFNRNGRLATYDHSIYLSWHAAYSTTMQASFNEIYNNTPQSDGICQGASIVAHGQHVGTTVIGNLIDNAGHAGGSCFGVQFSPGGYPHPEFFRGCRIADNRIYGTGAVGIDVTMATDTYVENNLVTIDGNGSGGVWAFRLSARNGWDGDDTARVYVRNNTFYFSSAATTGDFVGAGDQGEGTGHVIANNIFARYGSGGTYRCFYLSAGYDALANNLCYGGVVGSSSAIGTITSEPQFTNPGSGSSFDFTPAAGSPLVGAASATYAPSKDLTGKTRDGAPDVGAYER